MEKFQTKALILLIGNSTRLAEVCPTLQKNGYDVLTAANGDEGFCLARRERPDLIISEIALPHISGIELCYMIRADKYLKATPFIFTGEPVNEDGDALSEVFRAGADDFFETNCNLQFLALKIARLIEFRRAETELLQRRRILSRSETQLAKIIKDASNLISSLEPKINFPVFGGRSFHKSEGVFNNRREKVFYEVV